MNKFTVGQLVTLTSDLLMNQSKKQTHINHEWQIPVAIVISIEERGSWSPVYKLYWQTSETYSDHFVSEIQDYETYYKDIEEIKADLRKCLERTK